MVVYLSHVPFHPDARLHPQDTQSERVIGRDVCYVVIGTTHPLRVFKINARWLGTVLVGMEYRVEGWTLISQRGHVLLSSTSLRNRRCYTLHYCEHGLWEVVDNIINREMTLTSLKRRYRISSAVRIV
ncbi:hypothetical protein EV421DRAFT_1904197 [Armillaria borealis]|uniref:Uncharacterized protein n=1 Tax=Armillaria borealis TaxID=47425 RepID=A0AA39JL23_9AGAR|nr:hypothetical protein EV421DRAFT_1904194 [Armillaria borealis]KAK0442423.1 hypothetical protein EV421DRAFT_1904197 [Armillaria borealis]